MVLMIVGLGAALFFVRGDTESSTAEVEPIGSPAVVTTTSDTETTVSTAATPTTEQNDIADSTDPTTWLAAAVTGALDPFDNPDADPMLGQVASAVSGFNFAGESVDIADNGKPKILVFLAHWCPHCQREVPSVQAYLDAVGLPDGVELISVATAIDETRDNYPPDAWLDREGWSSPVIVDPDGAVASAYGLAAFPYYVFIREDFTVDFRITGELNPEPVFEYATTLFGPGPDRTPVVQGPTDYETAAQQTTACGSSAPSAPQTLSLPGPGEAPAATMMTFHTSCGDVVVVLDAQAAPETVASMLFLADEGYFDGTVCHRLVTGFVLQCGDPTGTGTGSPGYRLPDEFPETSAVYQPGTIAMANAGPGTTGSQFFVVIGDATFLSPQFTVIGTVADIEPLIAALSTVPLGVSSSGEQSAPLETIYIESVSLGG
jgi:peptidyl-prolyl cis-trans isomerase B (cyclophilin B)